MRMLRKICLSVIFACLICVTLCGVTACKKKGITLSFEANGGVVIEEISLNKGDEYTLPEPTREGYSFEGWYDNAEFEGEPITEIVVDKKATYYAKWEQMYLVTLDLNGGSLNYGKLYLKVGEIVYDAVKDFVPTKTGYQFGDWFVGSTVLSKNVRMTEEGVTLTAKYKVPYTVEFWTEKVETRGEYEKVTEDVIGYEYAGVNYTSEQKLPGFREVTTSSSVVTKVISENASENVFKHYFNRETYEVTFNTNYPDGTANSEYKTTVLYGVGEEVPSYYTCEGYCLIGWSTSVNGEVVYKANYIESALYNGSADESKADKVNPVRNTMLYGVWLKGYADMFNNGDYIYLLENVVTDDEGAETTEYSIYLSRGNVFFEGEYKAKTNTFSFTNANEKTVLKGKLNENGTFIYSDMDRADYSYNRFVFGTGLIASEKLYFGEYDEVTYSIVTDGISAESTGTYTVDGNYYVATFTEGELAGATWTMSLGFVSNSSTGTYDRAFQVRNDNEYELTEDSEMVRFAVATYQNQLYLTNYIYYMVTFDGFNTATFYEDDGSTARYNYRFNEEDDTIFALYNTDYSIAFIGKIMTLETVDGKQTTGYAVYTEENKGEFAYQGGMVSLDGYLNASYTKNGVTKDFYYSTTQSVIDGTVVTFGEGEDLYKMLITVEETTVGDMTYTSYGSVEKSLNYGEYYYVADGGLSYAPVLVANDPEDGMAIMYGITSKYEYKEVSRGTLVYDDVTGTYTYTVTVKPETMPEGLVTTFDYTKVETAVLSLDSGESSYYSIHYWYSYTDSEGGSQDFEKKYTSADGKELYLTSGVAIYKTDSTNFIKGIYQIKNNIITIYNAVRNELIYALLNEENSTFQKLQYAPYKASLLESNGNNISSNFTLTFDGLGGATYSVTETVEEEKVTTDYVGTVVDTGKATDIGLIIFSFTSEDCAINFKFVQVELDGAVYFAKECKDYETLYRSEKYGELKLDGFGCYALYTNTKGETYHSKYFINTLEEEGQYLVMMEIDGLERYFDINGNEFTMKGAEYNVYALANNQYMEDIDFLLDGYGGLKVSKWESVEEDGETKSKEVVIDKNGTYVLDGDVCTLTYVQDGKTVVRKGLLSVYYYNYGGQAVDIPVFVEDLGDIAQTYVNPKDFSVLILDAYGNAEKHTAKGVKEIGTYMLITDTLLYYVNESQDDACVYTYDKAEGSATQVVLTAKGYYTQDLESLIFTQYGFAIFNNDTRYYYYVEYDEKDNEIVTIYREATDEDTKDKINRYGFIEENFGEFSVEKEYDGKKYYANDGYAIVFKREVVPAGQEYPYTLEQGVLESISFTPASEGVFIVDGTAVFTRDGESKTYDCVVMRDADGTTLLSVDGYCYDITLNYLGQNENGTTKNNFTISGARQIVTMMPYNYGMLYYLYYYFMGVIYENDQGTISIAVEYNADGTRVSEYAQFITEFYEKSKMYDSNGNIVNVPADAVIKDADGNAVTDIKKLKVTGNDLYTVEFIAEDGYTYRFYFAMMPSQYLDGVIEFAIQGFVREEKLSYTDADNGVTYDLTVERVIYSDIRGYNVGKTYSLKLVKTANGEETTVTPWAWYEDEDGSLNVIVYTYDEDQVITSTVYYTFMIESLEEEVEELPLPGPDDGFPGDDDETETPDEEEEVVVNKNPLPVYVQILSAKECEGKTYYNAEMDCYIDLIDGQVKILAIGGQGAYLVLESTYDEVTNTYTCMLTSTFGYKVTLMDGPEGKYIVMEEVTVEAPETDENESTEGSQEE